MDGIPHRQMPKTPFEWEEHFSRGPQWDLAKELRMFKFLATSPKVAGLLKSPLTEEEKAELLEREGDVGSIQLVQKPRLDRMKPPPPDLPIG